VRKKNAAAQALVRRRWQKATAEERSAAARHAVNARWARVREQREREAATPSDPAS
jgi:hypothetical protein